MSILKLANDKTGNSLNSLQTKITYIQRAEETSIDAMYGASVPLFNAYNEMVLVKEAYDQLGGKGFYHLIFNPEYGNELSRKECIKMGSRMAEYISHFHGYYQVLMAMHEDGQARHFHFIANNINVSNGTRMNLDKKRLYELKQGLSRIAADYGIEPIRQYRPVE